MVSGLISCLPVVYWSVRPAGQIAEGQGAVHVDCTMMVSQEICGQFQK